MIEKEKEKSNEDWMNKKWRPAMGWVYMGTCVCDFVIFPVCWSLLQAVLKYPVTPWQPLTLQGAGLYHLAMGAVLGIAAFGRTQEKIAGATSVPTSPSSIGIPPATPSPISPATPVAPVRKAPPPQEEPAL